MRFKNTFILAGISLALLAYVIGVEFIWKEKAEKSEKEGKKVFHFNEDAVKRITLNTANGEIVLEKVASDTWSILNPIKYEADSTAVKSLITTIHNMEVKREIEVDNESPALYGFDNPQGKIKVDTELGSFSFRAGKKSPVSYQLYIMREGEKKVILTEAGLDNHLRKTVTDFRERRVIKFKRDDIQSITFTTKKGYTIVEKRGDDWFITNPLNVKASNEELNRILSTLDGLRVDTFVDDAPKDIKKYGLLNPRVNLSILLKEKGLIELKIGNESQDKKGVYAMVSTVPSVYLVRKSIIDDIGKSSDDLREKRIISFDLADVQKVEIAKQNEETVFERVDEENWKVNNEPAKKYEVESLIRKIRDAKAKSFLKADPKTIKETGIEKPSIVAKIFLKEVQEPLEIKLGKVKDKDVYASGTDRDWIVTLDSAISETLSKNASEFKEESQSKGTEKKK
jgi:hypothetical protein